MRFKASFLYTINSLILQVYVQRSEYKAFIRKEGIQAD